MNQRAQTRETQGRSASRSRQLCGPESSIFAFPTGSFRTARSHPWLGSTVWCAGMQRLKPLASHGTPYRFQHCRNLSFSLPSQVQTETVHVQVCGGSLRDGSVRALRSGV